MRKKLLRVSANSSKELRATVLAIKTLDRDLRAQLRKGTREVASIAWQKELGRQASTTLEQRALVDTARVSVSDQNVRIRSAGAKKKVTSGGLRPFIYGRGVEFGSWHGHKKSYQSRRRGGTPFTVIRHTSRQMRPPVKRGYVFFPAAKEMIPRLLAMWVQTTVRTINEALEAGGKR